MRVCMYVCMHVRRHLLLFFDEPVAAGSISLSSITLFSNESQSFAALTDPVPTANPTYVSVVNETILQVALSSGDLNGIKKIINSGNYIHIHTYISNHIYTYIHIYTCIYTIYNYYLHIHTYIPTKILHTYIHAVHIYMLYIHTYIHTLTIASLLVPKAFCWTAWSSRRAWWRTWGATRSQATLRRDPHTYTWPTICRTRCLPRF